MKQLTCEMCGSTDLLKQDGVFICQTCGCKYSVEEARKMMVEGTVDVKGTVKVDRSSEVNSILKNADTTYSDGNYNEAFDLYSQVLNIDPDNSHAIIYRAMSSAWQSTVKDCRINEINRASERAFKLQHQLHGDSKEYFDFCYDATLKIAPLINAIANMYINYYNKAKPRNYSITGAIATAGISQEVRNTMELGTKNSCIVSSNVITYVLNGVEDFSEASEGLWTVLHNMAHNCIVYRNNAKMRTDPDAYALEKRIDELKAQTLKDIEAKKEKERNDKIAKYWEEHAEEKIKLESELNDLNSQLDSLNSLMNNQISSLNEEISAIPGSSEIANYEEIIKKLTEEKSRLGLFKSKEKKTLQEQIDQAEAGKKAVQDRMELEKKDIESKINSIRSDFYQKTNPIEIRIAAINNELTKER